MNHRARSLSSPHKSGADKVSGTVLFKFGAGNGFRHLFHPHVGGGLSRTVPDTFSCPSPPRPGRAARFAKASGGHRSPPLFSAAEMVADRGLGNAEEPRRVRLRLASLLQDLDRHDLLPCELG